MSNLYQAFNVIKTFRPPNPHGYDAGDYFVVILKRTDGVLFRAVVWPDLCRVEINTSGYPNGYFIATSEDRDIVSGYVAHHMASLAMSSRVKNDYLHEKLLMAVEILSTGTSSLETRLDNAWDHLHRAASPHLDRNDDPDVISRFDDICDRYRERREGNAVPLKKLAEDIFYLYSKLTARQG